MIVLVVVNTVNMGAQLDIEIIKDVFKKPIGPLVGFLSQFGFMPLFSYFIGWVITEDKLFRYSNYLYFLFFSPLNNPVQAGPVCTGMLPRGNGVKLLDSSLGWRHQHVHHHDLHEFNPGTRLHADMDISTRNDISQFYFINF